MNFCLGYSEPEAGSDLASLRTRAVRDGDEWVINGQKLWTTGAHVSDWVWLAARTDPDAQPRHAGITVFLFPLETPGVTIQQHTALSGEVSCTVFYDNVRIPDSARVGESQRRVVGHRRCPCRRTHHDGQHRRRAASPTRRSARLRPPRPGAAWSARAARPSAQRSPTSRCGCRLPGRW